MASRVVRPVAIIAALVVLAAACGGEPADDSTAPTTSVPTSDTTNGPSVRSDENDTTAASSDPEAGRQVAPDPPDPVVWSACGAGLECGSVTVPLDHDAVDGATLDISLVRVPAEGEPVGSIFVNPGGPGGSGVDFVRSGFRFDPETSARYHLVGFDPRGIGESNPLTCSVDRAGAALPDLSPDTDQERDDLDADAEAVARQCRELDGALLPHLTTRNVARDLDLLRQAVGDETLHYYGLSYGTLLGFDYADQFPDSVGHLVLDGVVDPTADLTDLLLQQSRAFEAAFDRLDERCASGRIDCPADGLAPALERVVRSLEASGPQGEVGGSEVTMASLIALYSPDLWQPYASALRAADDGNLGPIESLSDLFLGSVSYTAYAAFACADDGLDRDPSDWDELAARAEAVAPRFGAVVANELRVCAHWPAVGSDPEQRDVNDVDQPILVIGTTGDAATPIDNAELVAGLFPEAHLLTVEGQRHTAYNGSACSRDVVARYFADDDSFRETFDCTTD